MVKSTLFCQLAQYSHNTLLFSELAHLRGQNTAWMDHAPLLVTFAVVFIVLFQLHFLSDRAVVSLIEFCTAIISPMYPMFTISQAIATLRRYTGLSMLTDRLRTYVSYPNCHRLYDQLDAPIPNVCNNDDIRYRGNCGALMFKTVAGRRSPLKTFAYQPLMATMERFFMRPGFEAKLEHWRLRRRLPGTYSDVYDGDMWNRVIDSNGRPFVNVSRSLLLTLNIDWFGPFVNSTYSIGAIYLTINNLPRAERFKTENSILVGVMPGPREASTFEINHFLRPLVDDLVGWYTGQSIRTAEQPNGAVVRLALLNVACDIPAARKVSGFTSHASIHACYKCYRQFATFVDTGRIDHSGFDVSTWLDRDPIQYLEHAEQWRAATTLQARTDLERAHGARWSELHRLRYFNPVACTIVDPMHNLFLGTAKRMAKLWIHIGDLRPAMLRAMQRAANSIVLPPDYVALKRKIEGNFSFMTADDWKSWILVYSPLVLQGHISRDKLNHWLLFVNACRALVRPAITETDLAAAHAGLLAFCRGVEEIYGPSEVTPNMHLHIHLKETVEKFSSLYNFWLFSFERYNGYIKDINTNQKDSFETTFMRKFQQKTGTRDFVRSFSTRFGPASAYMDLLNRFADNVQPIQAAAATSPLEFDVHQFYALSEIQSRKGKRAVTARCISFGAWRYGAHAERRIPILAAVLPDTVPQRTARRLPAAYGEKSLCQQFDSKDQDHYAAGANLP